MQLYRAGGVHAVARCDYVPVWDIPDAAECFGGEHHQQVANLIQSRAKVFDAVAGVHLAEKGGKAEYQWTIAQQQKHVQSMNHGLNTTTLVACGSAANIPASLDMQVAA